MLSPYLDLRRGGNPATNYFLGTIPEIARRYQYRQLNTQLQDLERQSLTAPAPSVDELVPQLPETGHPTTFGNLAPYYSYGNINTNPAQGQNLRQQATSRRGR
jgi:hypothetical protein